MTIIFLGELELVAQNNKEDSYKVLKNVVMHTKPLVVHGNGSSKIHLSNFGNYLAKAFHPAEGCRHCKHGEINLAEFKDFPVVLLSLFVEYPTPFLEEQLEKVAKIDYPKKKLHLFIHNAVSY